jgi:hypothetical protein
MVQATPPSVRCRNVALREALMYNAFFNIAVLWLEKWIEQDALF